MSAGRREGDDPVSDVPVSMLAPAGTFFDLGTWACAGVYATITTGGTVRVGDAVDQLPSL